MKRFLFITAITSVMYCFATAQNIDTVVFIPLSEKIPANAVKISTVKEGDNATQTHCDYESIMAKLKARAAIVKGNVVKVTELIPPAFVGKCYKVRADIYYAGDLNRWLKNARQPAAPKQPAQARDNRSYATIYVYRLKDTLGVIAPYKLHLDNDSVICTIKSRSRDTIRIYKEGSITLWAATEKRAELKLNARLGEEYYVRCGIKSGEIRVTPVLERVDEATGQREFATGKHRKRETGIDYLGQIH